MNYLLLRSATVAVALAGTLPAAAATTVFTDRTAFNAAAGAVTTENFNSYVSEVDFRTAPFDFGPFSIAGFGDQGGRNFIDVPPAQFGQFTGDGTTNLNLFTRLADGSGFEISFDAPVFAFGGDFSSMQDGLLRTRIIAAGDVLTPSIAGSFDTRFFGFTSDTAFSSIRFEGTYDGDGFSGDNFSFSRRPGGAVPEPATWAFMILGFGAVGASMRRRKANVNLSFA